MSDTQTAENAETGDAGQDIESRARAQGWRPKEEYKSKNGRPWVDAEQFLETSEKVLPVAMERNRQLEEKFNRTEAELRSVRGELGDVKQVLTDFREFASRGEQRAYERALKDLTDKRSVAVAQADVETFHAVDAEIAELNKTARTKADTAEKTETKVLPQPDAVITGWIGDNPWFNADAELNKFARHHDAYLLEAKPGLSVAERLAAVKAKTKAEFPDKFENPLRENASSVATPSGGGNGGRRVAKHSYENLPPEAKKACDKYVKSIPNYTREEYVKAYAWEDN